MIRTQAVVLSLGPTKLVVTCGWLDPNMLRTHMPQFMQESMGRFQTRMQLIGGNFKLEDVCDFLSKDAQLNPCKVHIMDGNSGAGIEWVKPTETTVDETTPQS